jgi:hypothetical protein
VYQSSNEHSNQLTGSLIYKLKGFDPDGDALSFGVQSTFDSDIITVKNLENNEAGIYLEKELDREVGRRSILFVVYLSTAFTD